MLKSNLGWSCSSGGEHLLCMLKPPPLPPPPRSVSDGSPRQGRKTILPEAPKSITFWSSMALGTEAAQGSFLQPCRARLDKAVLLAPRSASAAPVPQRVRRTDSRPSQETGTGQGWELCPRRGFNAMQPNSQRETSKMLRVQ